MIHHVVKAAVKGSLIFLELMEQEEHPTTPTRIRLTAPRNYSQNSLDDGHIVNSNFGKRWGNYIQPISVGGNYRLSVVIPGMQRSVTT